MCLLLNQRHLKNRIKAKKDKFSQYAEYLLQIDDSEKLLEMLRAKRPEVDKLLQECEIKVSISYTFSDLRRYRNCRSFFLHFLFTGPNCLEVVRLMIKIDSLRLSFSLVQLIDLALVKGRTADFSLVLSSA